MYVIEKQSYFYLQDINTLEFLPRMLSAFQNKMDKYPGCFFIKYSYVLNTVFYVKKYYKNARLTEIATSLTREFANVQTQDMILLFITHLQSQ